MYLRLSKIIKILLLPLAFFYILYKKIRFPLSIAKKISEDGYNLYASACSVKKDLYAAIKDQKASNPFTRKAETIFISITCGQAIRTFLLSDVLALLSKKYNIVIISQYGVDDEFVRTYSGKNIHVLPWIKNKDTLIQSLCKYYHMINSPSETHKSIISNLIKRKHSKPFNGKKIDTINRQYNLYRFVHFVNRFVGRGFFNSLQKLFVWTFLPHDMVKKLFQEYNPALVIITAAAHSVSWPLSYYGRHCGCKTLANVISWDNISTKGSIDTCSQNYALWSEEMSEEMAEYFPFLNCNKFIVGSPQFDIYFQDKLLLSREDFLNPLGLNPALPYILYTTNTPTAMPDEHIIIKKYWDMINASDLAGRVSLMIRLHPKDDIRRYSEIQGLENVTITLAGIPKWDGADSWIPGVEDMIRLANSMRHAAVSVNVASTMSLEGFCLQLPTINVAFKSDEMAWNSVLWSFEMYHTSVHYRALVEQDSVAVVGSQDELLKQTVEALNNGGARQEAMKKVLRQKAAYCEGTSARRFCEVVSEVLNSRN